MAEDDRGCGAANEGAKDIARMDLDPGQRSTGNAVLEKNPMAHVQRQNPEFLDLRGGKSRPIMRPDIGRIAQVPAALWPASGRAPAQLEGSLDHRCAGGADTRLGAQLGFGSLAKPPQIPQAGEQILCDLQGILPRTSAAQQDRKQLGV